ncbi:hypothetical protein L107_08868 [Cyanobium sp. Copco_Reservoir_LC18]|uniref:hypothetical protein n=1 Tax=Cyanobium sp. Copco_Reservoir_LC18 TaxID=1328305 RepID=UPI00135BFD37|nr:hypothetical protein [Cyanobium sp. Copco_Reservoir_LC18]KAF0653690.1 hypothetical protein L107_08868 [Cyanobium sp. Copco_Reservoir_LC18]
MSSDSYLSSISPESLEVIQHFGPEAPVKLNTYACAMEDALLESLERQKALHQELMAAHAEREQLRSTLTDPERLIAYVSRFFGPEGPCPGGAVLSRCQSEAAAR